MFIGHLDTKSVTPADLRRIFEKWGEVIEEPLILTHSNCAFIQYRSVSCVLQAMREAKGLKLGNNNIIVERAHEKGEKNRDRGVDRNHSGRGVNVARGRTGAAECVIVMLGSGQKGYGVSE